MQNEDQALALAFAIAGHHAGLADFGTPQSSDGSCLAIRLGRAKASHAIRDAIERAEADITEPPTPPLPSWYVESGGDSPLRLSLLTRMLLSCLVDADRIESERFSDPDAAKEREQPYSSLIDLRARLDEHLATLSKQRTPASEVVSRVRSQLLESCRTASLCPPGIFSLTAPTGAGKTLSSMAFALNHASRHGLTRVIYALPFTSVTEQVAREFRQVFGPSCVLEHHSAFQPPASQADAALQDSEARIERWRQNASENWDAPIIVTTNVRLLESLFACGTSDCRRLHRLARSVIVLDEAQALPVDLLRPTLAAFKELTVSYGTSIVVCTATMPAVRHRPEFPIGLRDVHEIVPDPAAMARSMRRVRVRFAGILPDEDIAQALMRSKRAIVIVNSRRHARRLFDRVREQCPDALHLSALMCPAHRADRVKEIHARLASSDECRVVSTQVVEAGVDIDFPIVYRALAGLDSIVQAAGRCNRHGALAKGEVCVFEPADPPRIPTSIEQAIGVTRQIIAARGGADHVDLLDLETIEHYFRQYVWERGGPDPMWDGPVGSDGRRVGITNLLKKDSLQFREAAAHFKLIDDGYSTPLVVPYDDRGSSLRERIYRVQLNTTQSVASLLRQAQPFTINVPHKVVDDLVQEGHALRTELGPAVLTTFAESSLYSPDVGLMLDEDARSGGHVI
jgi:CRISPR-associated endonuclease/helicase Cas3